MSKRIAHEDFVVFPWYKTTEWAIMLVYVQVVIFSDEIDFLLEFKYKRIIVGCHAITNMITYFVDNKVIHVRICT